MGLHSPSGLPGVPSLKWGSHMAQFFASGDDLRDLLVPYFKAGLENNERCLWVTGPSFNAAQARAALRAVMPDLDAREEKGQIEIADAGTWYSAESKLEPQVLVAGLLRREADALAAGYAGVRTNGNCAWVDKSQWADFLEYENQVHQALAGRRLICMCSYHQDQLADGARSAMLDRHDLVVALPKAANDEATTEAELRAALADQRRSFDLAMRASKMGTWRYTFADNICLYDENAQKLYGLSEGRFLHDEAGVNGKFHPDDIPLMWSRVRQAIDPAGDGLYDVEYRVKQADGRWHWVSAWGLVEFEGEGADKRPVAIAGASRDLSERKEAEEAQNLLINELNHRVKNTLATVQSIIGQTLRSATDLRSAKIALDRRIIAMAHAHDLLTMRAWTGANMSEIVEGALRPFNLGQVQFSGPTVEVSPRHTLALSLALHEMATNATKYGALSASEGRVLVQWTAEDGKLWLEWQEQDGPQVTAPTKQGFGTRLIQTLLRDIEGDAVLTYDPMGLRCRLTASV